MILSYRGVAFVHLPDFLLELMYRWFCQEFGGSACRGIIVPMGNHDQSVPEGLAIHSPYL